MNSNALYLAFFDLLGTRNISENAAEYYESINALQNCITHNVAYLDQDDNISNVSFFSDSCYVESSHLYELIKYITEIRDLLITKQLFFNAAIIKVDSNNYEKAKYTNRNISLKCSISGITFPNNSIAKAYIEQTRFKGIGILLTPDVAEDARKDERINVSKSLYLLDHTNNDTIKIYSDVFITAPSRTYESQWIKEIIKSYFFACCNNPRYGKYYISLIINIIQCSSNKIEWDSDAKRFVNSDYIYNTMLAILNNSRNKKYLVGLDIIAMAFVNKILSSSLLPHHIQDVINELLITENGVVNQFLNNLNRTPWIAFFGNKDNEETFKTYCRRHIVDTEINNVLE